MTKQSFYIENYWKVTVFYNIGSNLYPIFKELKTIKFPTDEIIKVLLCLNKRKTKAVTCSNGACHKSVVIFKSHNNKYDYINSLVHEAEHIKQAMLNTYKIEDEGEPPAYTIGYLVQRMWEVFKKII